MMITVKAKTFAFAPTREEHEVSIRMDNVLFIEFHPSLMEPGLKLNDDWEGRLAVVGMIGGVLLSVYDRFDALRLYKFSRAMNTISDGSYALGKGHEELKKEVQA